MLEKKKGKTKHKYQVDNIIIMEEEMRVLLS